MNQDQMYQVTEKALTNYRPCPLDLQTTAAFMLVGVALGVSTHPDLGEHLKQAYFSLAHKTASTLGHGRMSGDQILFLIQLQDMDSLEPVMAATARLIVPFTFRELWLVVTGIQLMSRHPQAPLDMMTEMVSLAKQVQAFMVELEPDVQELLDAGWDTRLDEPLEAHDGE